MSRLLSGARYCQPVAPGQSLVLRRDGHDHDLDHLGLDVGLELAEPMDAPLVTLSSPDTRAELFLNLDNLDFEVRQARATLDFEALGAGYFGL